MSLFLVPGPWSLDPGPWCCLSAGCGPGHGDHAAGGRLWSVCDGGEWREGPVWNLHTQEPAVVQGVGEADDAASPLMLTEELTEDL